MISPYLNDTEKFLKKFSMIFATSENGVIGNNNKLLWQLPNDLKRFKKLTTNKIVIMGKKTFDSLPDGALPDRLNIVLCNDDSEFIKSTPEIKTSNTGLVILPDIQSVFNFVHNYELNPTMKNISTDEYFIIGGGAIYNLFLPYVRKIYMTVVHTDMNGDTLMPDITKFEWEELEEIEHKKDAKHLYDYTFITVKRIK